MLFLRLFYRTEFHSFRYFPRACFPKSFVLRPLSPPLPPKANIPEELSYFFFAFRKQEKKKKNKQQFSPCLFLRVTCKFHLWPYLYKFENSSVCTEAWEYVVSPPRKGFASSRCGDVEEMAPPSEIPLLIISSLILSAQALFPSILFAFFMGLAMAPMTNRKVDFFAEQECTTKASATITHCILLYLHEGLYLLQFFLHFSIFHFFFFLVLFFLHFFHVSGFVSKVLLFWKLQQLSTKIQMQKLQPVGSATIL